MNARLMTVVVASLVLSSASLAAQDSTTAQRPVYKDPQLATVWGLVVPGGGQMYAGRGVKGAQIFAGSAGALTVGYLMSSRSCTWIGDSDSCTADRRQSFVIAGTIGALLWIYGLTTAADDAHDFNARTRALSQARVQPLFTTGRVGFVARVTFGF